MKLIEYSAVLRPKLLVLTKEKHIEAGSTNVSKFRDPRARTGRKRVFVIKLLYVARHNSK